MDDGRIDFVCPAPVAEARAGSRPIVALESTLISHGLPHPENIEVARGAEAAVRAAGAEPATMAVIEGRPHAGLDDAVMDRLATEEGVRKLSRRDLPVEIGRAHV